MNKLTHIEHDSYAHFNPAKNHSNDIDHVFISAPGWSQLNVQVQVHVKCPAKTYAEGLSDHSPLHAIKTGSLMSTRLSPWVAKLPSFKKDLETLIKAAELHNMLPGHAPLEYKRLIREAAKIARNEHNDQFRDSPRQYLPNLSGH